MKKIKFILLAVILASFAKANTGDDSFNLSVSSDGKLAIQQVQLLNSDGYQKTITKNSDGYFFTNTIDRFGIYGLSVTYIDPTSKKANGINVQLFLKAGDTKLVLQGNSGKYSITGASMTAQKNFEAFTSKDQVYLKKVMELESKLRQSEESGNRKITTQLKQDLNEAKNARKKNVYETYILQHPNDDLCIYAMRVYSSINMENPLEVKYLISVLGKELQESEEIIEMKKEAEYNERFMKGVKAPDFTQADTSGTAITLSSLQGRYVLIDFWASWCKPCRAQNPALVRIYKKYSNKGFTILGVSLDSKKESWLKAIHDDKLQWQQVSDLKFWKNDVAQQYKISSVPQNYLLNSQGVIIGKNLSESDLDEVLEKELSQSK